MLLTLAALANAASVTDFPPMLRGDLKIDYRGHVETGSLEEGEENFGRRSIHDEGIDYTLEFVPYTGIALNVVLPTTMFLRYGFADGKSMVFDPATGSGTYSIGSTLGSQPKHDAIGIDGVWIGAAFAPFSERYKRGHQVTWRLDAKVRTPNQKVFWTVGPNGRGSAPGGTAFLLGAAFSSDKQLTSPYLSFQYLREGRVTTDVVAEDGTTQLTGASLKAPDVIDLRAGFEVVGFYDPEDGSRVAFDLNSGFSYVSWAEVPSGLFLPDVLDSSKSQVVSTGDHLRATAGFGVDGHIAKYVGVRTGFSTTYVLPHRLEHPYPVRTGPFTFDFGWNFAVTGKLR